MSGVLSRRGAGLLVVAGLGLLVPVGLAAQQAKPDSTKPKPTQPTELVFEREVFSYPTVQRRNPFVPLTGTEQGPRFDQLRLMGIMFNAQDPSASVATIGTSTVRTSTDSTNVTVTPRGQAWYLKVGQTTPGGGIRVVSIQPDSVVVEVDEFGITERKVMRLETRGGTQ